MIGAGLPARRHRRLYSQFGWALTDLAPDMASISGTLICRQHGAAGGGPAIRQDPLVGKKVP